MSMIRVDYSNARAQAKKLDSAVAECETVIRNLNTVVSKLPSCWEGGAANAFLSVTQKRVREIKEIRDRAEKMAALIRRVADEFEEAERKMKEELAASATVGSAISSLSNERCHTGGMYRNDFGSGSVGAVIGELIKENDSGSKFNSGSGFGGGGSSGRGF